MSKTEVKIKDTKITIRQLKVKDRKWLTQLFKKAIQELGEEGLKKVISSNVSSSTESEKTAEEAVGETVVKIGINLLTKSIDIMDNEISAWFADLAGMSIEELDDMPIDTEAKIIEQIKSAPEAKVFFTQAWLLAKATSWFGTPLKLMREKFASMLELEKKNLENTPTKM